MDVTPQQFVDRLLSAEAHAHDDDGPASKAPMELPAWFDRNKFKAGQKFFWDNLFGQVASFFFGFLAVLAVPSILHVLAHSGRSSASFTAYKRYASTLLHAISWHKCDLAPGTESWKSLQTVRIRHMQAAKIARRRGVGTVSQRDIALTLWSLISHTIVNPHKLGIQSFDKDSWEGFNHFWRTIVSMLGLKDEYNICIGTVEDTREVCRILMEKLFAPLIEFPPEPFEHMSFVLLDGMWSVLPLSDPRCVLYMARYLVGVPGYVYTEQDMIDFRRKLKNGEIKDITEPVMEGWHQVRPRSPFNSEDFLLLSTVPELKKLTFFERSNLHLLMFLCKIYSTTIGNLICNGVIRLCLFLSANFPILAFHRFGFARSFVNMFEESASDKTKPLPNAEVLKMYERPPWYVMWNPFNN